MKYCNISVFSYTPVKEVNTFILWVIIKLNFHSPSVGDYVIVDPIEEGEKVKAEISFILYKDHIHYLQKQQLWWVSTHKARGDTSDNHSDILSCSTVIPLSVFIRPAGFVEDTSGEDNTKEQLETAEKDEEESNSEDDESDLFVNTNRCNYHYSVSEEDSEEDAEEEEK